MSHARITRLRPMRGREAEIKEVLGSYLAWLKRRPGFLVGFCLTPQSDRAVAELVRVIVWEGQSWADATALSEHALATRSHLLTLTEDQTIHENEFTVDRLEWAASPRVSRIS